MGTHGRSVARIARACVAIVVAVLAASSTAEGPLAARAARAAEAPPCVDGLDLVAPTSALLPEAVVALSSASALYAGGAPLRFGRRAAAIARFDERGWQVTARHAVGRDAAYMALDEDGDSLWAVGFVRTPDTLRPLIARRRASNPWRLLDAPRREGGATLTDVASDGTAGTWAVGYTIGQPGRHRPWVLRWDGRRFVERSPRLREGERGRLTAASVDTDGGTWIAGSVLRAGIVHPYIARRSPGAWARQSLPDLGEAVMADIDVPARDAGWAVGFRHASDGVEPLALRWDGRTWTEVDTSALANDAALLLAGWSSDGVRATVVGAAWDRQSTRFAGLTARGGSGGWSASVVATLAGQVGLTAVDGLQPSPAWLAGSTAAVGAAARTCDPIGVTRAERRATRERRRRQSATATRAARGIAAGDHEEAAPPQPAASLDPAPRLQVGAAGDLVLRDRTAEAGLPRTSRTWGAVVADFDADGADDVFLGRHGSAARLFLARGSRFVDSGGAFANVDRHGCAASDVDDSGRPDLYCTVGGRRGSGVKANQLWLDPASSGRALDPLVGRAPEPLGRGRVAAFLDVDLDGQDDLFVGQDTERMDGLPSDGRIYLRRGPARFRALAGSGIDPGLSTRAVSVGDVDGDRRDDLLVVHADPHSVRATGGIRLYRNVGGRLRDVTRAQRIRSIGESDAELADLDGDGRDDLIQLSGSRIWILLERADGHRPVFERRLNGGVAVAVGDADGDGNLDIYVLRQKDRARDDDTLLLGRRGGRDWFAVQVPSRHGGVADDVVTLDHDRDGRTDFLALNGGDGAGPVQLIASYPG